MPIPNRILSKKNAGEQAGIRGIYLMTVILAMIFYMLQALLKPVTLQNMYLSYSVVHQDPVHNRWNQSDVGRFFEKARQKLKIQLITLF